ncbi:DUF1648 domain-containing protein [Anaerorhabdus sp.]|uniref:DUF1648 domain-containing protein n=1 Tax=Anaerorhabdus sp. TaxID=1872524 RepID=UPI002FCC1598
MRKVDWKIIVITTAITWSPMIVGAILYQDMPKMIASHFNIYGQPDAYMPKEIILFVLPFIMGLLQIFTCYLNDVRNIDALQKPKVEYIAKFIIPVLSFIVYFLSISYSIGIHYDMRLVMMMLIGSIFILIGNYLPKTSGTYKTKVALFSKNKDSKLYNFDPVLRKKMYRVQGITFVLFGFLCILSVLLPAEYSFGVIILLLIVSLLEATWFILRIYRKD